MRSLWLLLLACLLAGCANRPESTVAQQQRIASLAQVLQQLAPQAPPGEAARIATVAVTESAALREQYGVRLTPWMHNVEVNSGTRPRGHCYHYARDLRSRLQPLVAPYWQLYPVHARPDTILEHNAIVIAGVDQSWEQGMVLDAWRDAGVLYFGPVQADDYPWRLRN